MGIVVSLAWFTWECETGCENDWNEFRDFCRNCCKRGNIHLSRDLKPDPGNILTAGFRSSSRKISDIEWYYDVINNSESSYYYIKTGFQFIRVIVGDTLLTYDIILPTGGE